MKINISLWIFIFISVLNKVFCIPEGYPTGMITQKLFKVPVEFIQYASMIMACLYYFKLSFLVQILNGDSFNSTI